MARNAAGMLFGTDSPQALGQPTDPSQVIRVDPAGASTIDKTLVAISGLFLAPAGIGVAEDGTLLATSGNAALALIWCNSFSEKMHRQDQQCEPFRMFFGFCDRRG